MMVNICRCTVNVRYCVRTYLLRLANQDAKKKKSIIMKHMTREQVAEAQKLSRE